MGDIAATVPDTSNLRMDTYYRIEDDFVILAVDKNNVSFVSVTLSTLKIYIVVNKNIHSV